MSILYKAQCTMSRSIRCPSWTLVSNVSDRDALPARNGVRYNRMYVSAVLIPHSSL